MTPDTGTLHQILTNAQEFGVVVTVLFILLLSLLSFMSVMTFTFGKKLEEIKESLSEHRAKDDEHIRKCDALRAEIQSFRDSEKDCAMNLKILLEKVRDTCEGIDSDLGLMAQAQRVLTEQATIQGDKLREAYSFLIGILKKRGGIDDGNGKD